MLKTMTSFAILAVLTCSVSAFADEPHQGFQLRLSTGLGNVNDSESTSGSTVHDSVSGLTSTSEIYMGGYALPGLAVGGMLSDSYMPSPSITVSNGSVSESVPAAPNSHLNLMSLGPYVDWYPLAGYGLHGLATFGYSNVLALAQKNSQFGNGWDLGAGVGYDFQVSNTWSLGVLARLSYANLTFKQSAESVVVPAILFSASYH